MPQHRYRAAAARLFVLMIALGFPACGVEDEPPPVETRIVLITLDTLRFDRFAGGATQESAMPLTRARAERGIVFERFYTVLGSTQPAHASLFSGRQPWEHGITRNGSVMSADLPNVAEILQRAGFETRAVVASFPLTRPFGFARGFDVFVEDFSENVPLREDRWEEAWTVEDGFFATAGAVTAGALDALDEARGRKQFFWFHYFDAHSPYGASSGGDVVPWREVIKAVRKGGSRTARVLERAKAGYDADVQTLDRALDRLLQYLDDDRAAAATHVLVVADHGESLGEGRSIGHGVGLNEAELRVPAFLLSPRVEPGVTTQLSTMIDLAPTLLSLAGVAFEPSTFAGRDLTAPGPAPEMLYALRRTARSPGESELRLDGHREPLDEVRFAVIDTIGEIRRGSSRGITGAQGRPVPPDATAAVTERLSAFEAELAARQRDDSLAPELRRGLEALGYVDPAEED